MSKKSGGCYIDVWRDANFEGEVIRIEGPAEYPNLGFANGDWGDHIGSLRVGPFAFVLAYRDHDFKDTQFAFGPNQEVANLDELDFDDDMDSIKVIDSLRILDYRAQENQPETSAGQAKDDAPSQAAKKSRQKGKRR
ncbi:MAG: hypothetical protein WCF57_18680 [Pyrinomonadaceae bacterium]